MTVQIDSTIQSTSPTTDRPNRHPMIKAADIKNFRCFKSVSQKNCKTINVTMGRNASGKTALLEAIFLALGNSPELALRFHTFRGLPFGAAQDPEADKFLWKDLFHDMNLDLTPSISLTGNGEHERALWITYGWEKLAELSS